MANRITSTRCEHDATNFFVEGKRIIEIEPNIIVTDGLEATHLLSTKPMLRSKRAKFADHDSSTTTQSSALTAQSRKEPRVCEESIGVGQKATALR